MGDAAVEIPPDDVPWLPESLGQRQVYDLRRPFSVDAVQYRPLGKAGKDKKAAAAFYIDARDVVDRLNLVVGAQNWSDSYEPLLRHEAPEHFFPVECQLTVFDVTKVDVGQAGSRALDDKCWKAAYSDALKRAAVKFGIGAYLYAIPRIRVGVDLSNDGERVLGFTRDGAKALEGAYLRWLQNAELNPFGPALVAPSYRPDAPVDPAPADSEGSPDGA